MTAELGLDRSAIGLALAELRQQTNDLAGAVHIVEQLESTTCAAVSLAELYDGPEAALAELGES